MVFGVATAVFAFCFGGLAVDRTAISASRAARSLDLKTGLDPDAFREGELGGLKRHIELESLDSFRTWRVMTNDIG